MRLSHAKSLKGGTKLHFTCLAVRFFFVQAILGYLLAWQPSDEQYCETGNKFVGYLTRIQYQYWHYSTPLCIILLVC